MALLVDSDKEDVKHFLFIAVELINIRLCKTKQNGDKLVLHGQTVF